MAMSSLKCNYGKEQNFNCLVRTCCHIARTRSRLVAWISLCAPGPNSRDLETLDLCRSVGCKVKIEMQLVTQHGRISS